MSGYLTVNGEKEREEIIERSKFICKLCHVESEEEAKQFIEKVKKEHSLATHNCYAYIADDKGLVQKFSDDGEPQGTAGLPMLNALKMSGLKKVVAVVTRYFGGIKLGTGGLARAYGGAVSECIKVAEIINMQKVAYFEIVSDYDLYSKLINIISRLNIPVVSTDFANDVRVKLAVKLDDENSEEQFLAKIYDLYKGKDVISEKSYGYYPFKV